MTNYLKATLFFLAVPLATFAAPPQLLLQVSKFRDLAKPESMGEVEVAATVPTQPLAYKKRGPKIYQAGAVVELSVVNGDGQPVWQETVTLKPPVLNDTTIAIKNPMSFLKRVRVPDGSYTLRGKVRDLYRATGGETTVELPLVVAATAGPALSDVLLLARPAPKATTESYFNRGGYLLSRAPGNYYGRGADVLYFYTELEKMPAGRPVRLHYHLAAPDGTAADADAPAVTPLAGRATPITGQLPLGVLPEGAFALTVEVRDVATRKLLATKKVEGKRSLTDYAPAGAMME